MIAYGKKMKKIKSLSLIDDDDTNFYNFEGLNFLTKLKKDNRNLVIVFHGAVTTNIEDGINRVVFRGFNWLIPNTDILCISDYILSIYEQYRINWFLSTSNHNADMKYTYLFDYIISSKNYENIIFTGTSAGGYPSIRYASKYNEIALIGNSQLYLEQYYVRNKRWKGGYFQNLNMIELNGDKLIYSEKDLEKIIIHNKPKKLIIYQNIEDKTHCNYHYLPFKEFIINSGFSDYVEFNLFENKDKSIKRKPHGVTFPEDEKHISVLKKLLA